MLQEPAARQERVSPWLNTKEAATYLGYSEGTLKAYRSMGRGPRYRVVGGGSRGFVRYHLDDLDAFVRGETAA